jgi:hypothetical protein
MIRSTRLGLIFSLTSACRFRFSIRGSNGRSRACRRRSSLGTCLGIVLRPQLQGRFFYPCNIESFLQDLDFHGLAAEQPLQLPYPPLELPIRLVPTTSSSACTGCSPPSSMRLRQLNRSWAQHPPAVHVRHGHPRLHSLFHEPDLLGSRPPTPALHRGDYFNTRRRTIRIGRHSRNHRRMPMPYRATLPVRSKRGAVHIRIQGTATLGAKSQGNADRRTCAGCIGILRLERKIVISSVHCVVSTRGRGNQRSSVMLSSPRRLSCTMQIFLRVARCGEFHLLSYVTHRPGFLSHLCSYDSQKSSLIQFARSAA